MRANHGSRRSDGRVRMAALVLSLAGASLPFASLASAQGSGAPRRAPARTAAEEKLSTSVGPAGANAKISGISRLGTGSSTLTGAGIAIGQVELGRPPRPGFDGDPAKLHPDVVPAGVYLRDGAAVVDQNLRDHPLEVAGIMISKNATYRGVAPGASLHASAIETFGTDPGYQHSPLAMQHVATRNGGDVRAINVSFGKALVAGAKTDGSSLFTQGLDWSARIHDALYVVAGNEGGNAPVPTDEYNGMTVGYTKKVNGVFRRVDDGNSFDEDADGDRRSIDLVAPGDGVTTTAAGGGFVSGSGTSFAAPHVTGTVALLQQYGDSRIAAGVPRWNVAARRHEVMKAVLMNSADKVKDNGDGNLLRMEKTIEDTNGADWLASDAYTSAFVPLHAQMGTGQLNARRALTQFEPGEWNSFGTAEVPLIGWDRGFTAGAGLSNKYVFERALRGGSYVSVTLAWDREVQLVEAAGSTNGSYDIGETFTTLGLTDMDLHLLPKGATDLSEAIDRSTSLVDNVEHIFFKIPRSGEYEFWVNQFDQPLGDQFYGVAWWAVAAPEPSTVLLVASGLVAVGVVARRRRA